MRSLIVGVVLGVLLVGCGGGEAKDPGSTSDGPSLSDFIPGYPEFNESSAEQDALRQEREVQDKIAACMAAEGFEYIPYIPNEDESGYMMVGSQEEWVEQYGFGIATMMLEDQREYDEEAMAAEMAKDPNNAIVDAMSASEQNAYYTALYGEQPLYEEYEESGDVVATTTMAAITPSGCQSMAYEEVYDQGAVGEFYELFGAQMMDVYSGIESDPKIVTLNGEWSSCMANQGYDFATESDAQIHIMRRLEEVGAITDLDISENGWGYGSEGFEPGSATEAAVREIATEELVIAKASLECWGDREKVYEEVIRDAERRFIEENLAELEQFKRDHS